MVVVCGTSATTQFLSPGAYFSSTPAQALSASQVSVLYLNQIWYLLPDFSCGWNFCHNTVCPGSLSSVSPPLICHTWNFRCDLSKILFPCFWPLLVVCGTSATSVACFLSQIHPLHLPVASRSTSHVSANTLPRFPSCRLTLPEGFGTLQHPRPQSATSTDVRIRRPVCLTASITTNAS